MGTVILTEYYSLNPARIEQVALATCPTHACYDSFNANFLIKRLL